MVRGVNPDNLSAPGGGGALVAAVTRADIQRVGQKLPSAPQVFSQIGKLLADLNSSLNQVVELVRLDTALAARVLQVSNGAFYGFTERCSSLDEAINRLGFREIHRLVGVIAAQNLFCNELRIHQVSGQLVWENSVSSALAMEWLARQKGGDEPLAYAAGLMRSLGKIVLDGLIPNAAAAGRTYPGEAVQPSLPAWERRVFGITNAEIGAVLMEHWKFPRRMSEAVRLHLEPERTREAPEEAYLLNMTGWVTTQLGKGLPGEAACWNTSPSHLAAAGVTQEQLEQCVLETRTAVNEAKSAWR
jgi:HD-like signal output (HDOD) protein